MLRDLINLLLAGVIMTAIAVGVTTFMLRDYRKMPQIVVLDVSQLMAQVDMSAPDFAEQIQRATDEANRIADRLASRGYIVLDGRGVMRAPPDLSYAPNVDRTRPTATLAPP